MPEPGGRAVPKEQPVAAEASPGQGTNADLAAAAARPRFTDLFVRRPVLAVVISLSLALIGVRVAIDMPVNVRFITGPDGHRLPAFAPQEAAR